MTGSIPSCRSAIATATGEACACAEVLSVALTASTQSSKGAKRSRDGVEAARVERQQLRRDGEPARRERVLKPGHPTPSASAGRAC